MSPKNPRPSAEKKYYESYNNNALESGCYLLEREKIMLRQVKGHHVLDIGCGPGKNGLLLKKVNLYGTDIFTDPAELINERHYREVCVLDISKDKLPFKDGSMDTVICMETLEHLVDPIHALAEANRVLKTNGQLIISVPNIGWFFSRILHLFGIFADLHDYQLVPSHIRFYTVARMKKILSLTGFGQIKVIGTTDFVSPVPGQSMLNTGAKLYPPLFASNPVFISKKVKAPDLFSNSYHQISGLSQGIGSLINNK